MGRNEESQRPCNEADHRDVTWCVVNMTDSVYWSICHSVNAWLHIEGAGCGERRGGGGGGGGVPT